jgi:hypothetical protein
MLRLIGRGLLALRKLVYFLHRLARVVIVSVGTASGRLAVGVRSLDQARTPARGRCKPGRPGCGRGVHAVWRNCCDARGHPPAAASAPFARGGSYPTRANMAPAGLRSPFAMTGERIWSARGAGRTPPAGQGRAGGRRIRALSGGLAHGKADRREGRQPALRRAAGCHWLVPRGAAAYARRFKPGRPGRGAFMAGFAALKGRGSAAARGQSCRRTPASLRNPRVSLRNSGRSVGTPTRNVTNPAPDRRPGCRTHRLRPSGTRSGRKTEPSADETRATRRQYYTIQ